MNFYSLFVYIFISYLFVVCLICVCWGMCAWGMFVYGGGRGLFEGRVGGDAGGVFWGGKGVWVFVCSLKYPGFEVLYFNFLYNY